MEIYYVLIGLLSGIFTGSIGVGSGVLMIPFLTYLGMTLSQSVAVSLVIQLIPQSFFGAYEYYKAGDVKWIPVLFVLIGSAVGIYLGSIINVRNLIDKKYLYLSLSIILFFSSIYIFIKHVWRGSTKLNLTN